MSHFNVSRSVLANSQDGVHEPQIYYIKVGSCVSHFNVSLIVCWQSHQTVSINHRFRRARRAEADRTEILLLNSVCVAYNAVITVKHILTECADLLEIRKKYFEERSLCSLFRNLIPEMIFDFLREIGGVLSNIKCVKVMFV